MIEVAAQVGIRRPLDEVQRQFGDVGYHQRAGHHRGVQFVVHHDAPDRCEYDQVTRVGPLRLRQTMRLDRADPAHQVNSLVKGPFAPGSITFEITPESEDVTNVVATLRSEQGGLARLAAPLLRRQLRRALAQALDEDRKDLESGAYADSRA